MTFRYSIVSLFCLFYSLIVLTISCLYFCRNSRFDWGDDSLRYGLGGDVLVCDDDGFSLTYSSSYGRFASSLDIRVTFGAIGVPYSIIIPYANKVLLIAGDPPSCASSWFTPF